MSRSAAAQTERPPEGQLDLLDKNKPVDNSGVEVEHEEETPIEVSVEGDPEPAPVAAKEEPPKGDQGTQLSALQKQLDELRKSEEISKQAYAQAVREREQAIEQSRKAETESSKYRADSEEAKLDAINNAMVAAQEQSQSAERELEQAIANADTKAQAEAYRKMSRAEVSYRDLENGKSEMEYRIQVAQQQRKQDLEAAKQPQEQSKDLIDTMQVPERAREWLREHRDYVTDPRKNAKLQNMHWEALDAGHKEFSTGYFIEMEKLLGLIQTPEVEVEVEPKAAAEPRRTTIVSAPVSREAPSSGSTSPTRVRLTREQSEMAKLAGITDAEYAKQLLRLNDLKKNGNYGESR